MLTILLAIAIFTAVMAMLAVGVMLGKRTPLKGSCHGPNRVRGGEEQETVFCESCTCSDDFRRGGSTRSP